jgi:hypothetical protein
MPPVSGHVPDLYVVASACISLAVGVVGFATWAIHRVLDALRDIRRYRQED